MFLLQSYYFWFKGIDLFVLSVVSFLPEFCKQLFSFGILMVQRMIDNSVHV